MTAKHTFQKVEILSATAVSARLKRMAYEIYEANFGEEEVVVVGIGDRGSFLAEKLAYLLGLISPLKVWKLSALKLENGRTELQNDKVLGAIKGKPVVIVDDVLYSGTTLFHTVAGVMKLQPAKIQCAILIDRGHRSLPLRPDFVGILLATSLKQHVLVEISKESDSATAYLM